jgi:para-aminobenzoate synthetase/4-amino-4-deoxychorismate lyase
MALATLAREHVSSIVVRLTVDPDGTVKTLVRPRPPDPLGPVTLAVSPFRTDPDDLLLRHKTTVRPLYDREYQRVQQSGYFDALFLNRLGQVTEGAITNVAARFGDRWVTPPLEDGLLPGIWRAHFIRTHACTEESLTIDDLAAADEVVIGNSVRGTVRVAALVLDALEGLLD